MMLSNFRKKQQCKAETKLYRCGLVWLYTSFTKFADDVQSNHLCDVIWETRRMEGQKEQDLIRRCAFYAASDQSLDFLHI